MAGTKNDRIATSTYWLISIELSFETYSRIAECSERLRIGRPVYIAEQGRTCPKRKAELSKDAVHVF